jgi:hypothetical protein
MIERIHDIKKILDLKEKLVDHPKLQPFLGQQLTGTTFRNFLKEFGRLLPVKVMEQVLRESFVHLAGQVLTIELLDENAWRMAANLDRAKAWRPVVPWSRQVDHEYVPVQIVHGRRAMLANKAAIEFQFQILAGTPATCIITKLWSPRLCAALSRRLGFSNQRGAYPFMDGMQFVNLRMYVLIDPVKSGKAPDFEEVWMEDNDKTIKPVSCYNYNRKMLRMRAGKGFPCPGNFDREIHPCHLCQIGQDRCVAAVHDETYVQKFCAGCSTNSWFDPAVPGRQVCVNCFHKSLGKTHG